MANRTLAIFLFFCSGLLFAQQDSIPRQSDTDSLAQNLNGRGFKVEEVVKRKINPLAPSRAAFYSALLPGLGQAYNKRYWKVPLVYAALGTGVYAYNFNNTQYNRYRDAFKARKAGLVTDEFYDINGDGLGPDVSDTALEDAQVRFQEDRDLSLLITIVLYALNIIDANVDAHLKQYNVSEELTIDFQPFLERDPFMMNPYYGMAFQIKF